MDLIKELGVPTVGFILFFIIQARGKKPELVLSAFILIVILVMFAFSYHPNEWLLFLIGIAFGIVIEVILRRLGSQQVWKNSSFFGVPYWLPLAWGIGFIIITRIGIFVKAI